MGYVVFHPDQYHYIRSFLKGHNHLAFLKSVLYLIEMVAPNPDTKVLKDIYDIGRLPNFPASHGASGPAFAAVSSTRLRSQRLKAWVGN